jgi:hypothetical protein
MHVTQTEKEKFLLSLDEGAFREKVVRRLFKTLGFRDGRDLCGPEEFGKDAVFVEMDKFGDESLVAVQTKVGSVSMAGDPSKNLLTILSQLRTALDHPYACVRSKSKKFPSSVYLIASGTVNMSARNHILQEINNPRLRFLDRDDLISKIDETCPEIWSGIVAEISPYLRALAIKVDELSVSVQDINQAQTSLGAFAAASDRNFVDITLGYQDLIFEKRSGQIFEDVRFGEIKGTQLFRAEGTRALILGDAGSGKTTLMVRLAYMLAKSAIISTKTYKVPIFVRAHELVDKEEGVFATLSKLVMQNQGLETIPFSLEDFEEGRVVLLADGLDELSVEADRQSTIDFCLKFASEYPRCSLALTTRPYSSVDRLAGLEKFKRFRVSPLSIDDASKMLKTIEEGEAGSDWRRETLRKLQGVHGVELNPLLVTVFAVSSKIDKKDVPANITELFAKFTELMLGRWDEKKGLGQQYQSRVKDTLLSEFAFNLHKEGHSTFSRSDFISFAEARLSEINLSADLDTLVSEILDRSGLLRGDREMEFRHHLLQEYFAAKGIPSIDFVRESIGNDWWRNAIVFYFGANPSSVDELLDVATSFTTDPASSFIAVGLALQACYLSRMDDRVEVWKWVNCAASDKLESVLRETNMEGVDYPISHFLHGYLEARDAMPLSGIQEDRYRLFDWCSGAANSKEVERRTFWYMVGLGELGEFSLVNQHLEGHPISDSMLLLGVHFGCFFARELKTVSGSERLHLEQIVTRLNPIVAPHRHRITEEFKGQLLEYRRGGVVALDEPEPVVL